MLGFCFRTGKLLAFFWFLWLIVHVLVCFCLSVLFVSVVSFSRCLLWLIIGLLRVVCLFLPNICFISSTSHVILPRIWRRCFRSLCFRADFVFAPSSPSPPLWFWWRTRFGDGGGRGEQGLGQLLMGAPRLMLRADKQGVVGGALRQGSGDAVLGQALRRDLELRLEKLCIFRANSRVYFTRGHILRALF